MNQSDKRVLRVLHVHQRAAFMGGVEQILFDTATGLSEAGWPQALLYSEGALSPAFAVPFLLTGDDYSLIERFKPDVLLLHKVEDIAMVSYLANTYPAVRMVHDHDVVCLRRHKYFPISTRICNKPAGINCYTHLCFILKSGPDAVLPISFKSVAAQKKVIRSNDALRALIVGSQWMREELVMNGIEDEKVHVIHPIPRESAENRVLPPSGRREILYVGQIIRGKGVDLMLQALALLKTEWHATIIGTGNHLEYCQRLARRLGLSDQVKFAGWVDHVNLNQYYANALFTVVPSRWPEPFGMVGVEAMSRGVPVVGFHAGGIPDWLAHEKTGLIAAEGDVHALAHEMGRMLSDPEWAIRLGQAAMLSVQEEFRHDTYLSKIMSVMKGLV